MATQEERYAKWREQLDEISDQVRANSLFGDSKLKAAKLEDVDNDEYASMLQLEIELDKRVADRVHAMEASATANPAYGLAKKLPGLTPKPVAEQIQQLRAMMSLNDREVTSLVSKLAVHIALHRRLVNRSNDLKSALNQIMSSVPESVQKFAVQLYDAGLTAKAAADTSLSDGRLIAALLNDRRGPGADAALAALKENTPAARKAHAEAVAAEVAQIGVASRPQPSSLQADEDDIEIVIPEFEESMIVQPKRSIPDAIYWSTVQSFTAPFRWEYREFDDTDHEALGFLLPFYADAQAVADSMKLRLPEWETLPVDIDEMREFCLYSLSFSGAKIDLNNPDPAYIDAWVFLIFMCDKSGREIEKFTPLSTFEGLKFPCAANPDLIRVLVRE